jgi:sodium/proline symporter
MNFSQTNTTEMIVFIIHLVAILAAGIYFFIKGKDGNEKDYFLGGRKLGPWVSALSAGASDMSAWVLMGLPASIYLFGIGQVWIAIGLFLGYFASWTLFAPRLRQFTIAANDSITLPQYLTNRFLSKNKSLQVICATIFLFAYSIYASASIKACGTLFNTVFGIDARWGMYGAAFIIVGYTFLGGYQAVCVTDLFQGMMMLGALMLAPIFALFVMESGGGAVSVVLPANYWNLLSSGRLDWQSWADILTGLGWGLGYFGMPHIIVRFMSIRSQKEVKKSAIIGISWNFLILTFAVIVGIIGRMYLGDIADSQTVFIMMVRSIFPAVISGILLSAILTAAMSTADSQLLVASSAFAADVYKPIFRKKASDKEMLWIGRLVVIAVSVAAILIASNPNSGTIMN